MFELFVASDAARRLIANSLEAETDHGKRPAGKRVRPRRRIRSASAAGLRRLAERLEPSPSA